MICTKSDRFSPNFNTITMWSRVPLGRFSRVLLGQFHSTVGGYVTVTRDILSGTSSHSCQWIQCTVSIFRCKRTSSAKFSGFLPHSDWRLYLRRSRHGHDWLTNSVRISITQHCGQTDLVVARCFFPVSAKMHTYKRNFQWKTHTLADWEFYGTCYQSITLTDPRLRHGESDREMQRFIGRLYNFFTDCEYLIWIR